MFAFFVSLYLILALLLAVGLIVALVSSVAFKRRFEQNSAWLLIALLMIGGAMGVIFSGRDLSMVGSALAMLDIEDFGRARWVNRGFILLVLALSFAILIDAMLSRTKLPRPGRTLFLAFLAFYLTQSFLPSAFGTKPAFLHNQLYPLIVVTALYLAPRPDPERFQALSKWLLFALLLGSLVVTAIKPGFALQSHYHGWLPGLDVRLWGLASHANLIGPPALTLLLLEYLRPSRNLLLRAAVWLTALTVLILAQSKTTWAVALLCLGFLMFYRHLPNWSRGLHGGIGQASAAGMLQLLAILFGVAVLLVGLVAIDPGWVLDKIMASEVGTGLETASGRAQIWDTALDEWRRNWLFGYGPLIWGDYYRFQHGMFTYAFHAHNQVLQTVSMGGAGALAGLLIYLITLLRYATRSARATKGVTMAMLLILLVRGLTEVPLPQHSMFSTDFLLHCILFVLLLSQGSVSASQAVPEAGKLPNAGRALGMGLAGRRR